MNSDDILYWMSRDEDRVLPPKRTAGSTSPWLLAETVTDLPRADYRGPIPEPGETVQGTVDASFTYIGAGVTTFRVYLRAERTAS